MDVKLQNEALQALVKKIKSAKSPSPMDDSYGKEIVNVFKDVKHVWIKNFEEGVHENVFANVDKVRAVFMHNDQVCIHGKFVECHSSDNDCTQNIRNVESAEGMFLFPIDKITIVDKDMSYKATGSKEG